MLVIDFLIRRCIYRPWLRLAEQLKSRYSNKIKTALERKRGTTENVDVTSARSLILSLNPSTAAVKAFLA